MSRSSIKVTYRIADEDGLPVVDQDFADVRQANKAAMASNTAEYDIDEFHDGVFHRTVARARRTQE